MEKLIIDGGTPLKGRVKISGSKNAALPILAATVVYPNKYSLNNIPDIQGVRTMLELLKILGAKYKFKNNKVVINTINIKKHEAPYDLVKTMRASVLIWGALLSRLGRAKISFPGGCAIGDRPVDQHLSGFESIGYKTIVKSGYLESISKGPVGGTFKFRVKTVTGTENLILASILGNQKTILENCSLEPEVDDLINFLNSLGAKIVRKKEKVIVTPVTKLEKQKKIYKVIPDRIEAGTFMYLGCIFPNKITITNAKVEDLKEVLSTIRLMGAKVEIEKASIKITPPKTIQPIQVQTNPFPRFPTDLQAQLMAVLIFAKGVSKIQENVFPNRFIHVAELRKLGANITIKENTAKIIGIKGLAGAKIQASDLRASAGLILSALSSKGKTEIFRIYHLDRGYERIDDKLKLIGAKIWREKE